MATPERFAAAAADFSREAVRAAVALNLGSLVAMALLLGFVGDLGAAIPVGAVVLAVASFALGGAFAGLFAFLGHLHYLWRGEALLAEMEGRDPARPLKGVRASRVLGVGAGTLSYLAFMSGWIFIGDGAIRAVGWTW